LSDQQGSEVGTPAFRSRLVPEFHFFCISNSEHGTECRVFNQEESEWECDIYLPSKIARIIFFFRFLRTIGTQYLAEMKAGKERKQRELSKLEEVTKNSGQTRGRTVHNWYGMCVVQVVR
jgi:hypothetical protein